MLYLAADEIAGINEVEVGPNLVADRGLLESAAQRPRQSAGGDDAYPDVHSKAAALLHSLAKNHPFLDGNKRTAVLAVGMFYTLNRLWLMASQDELIQLALDVVEDRLTNIDAIAEHLSRLVKELPIQDE